MPDYTIIEGDQPELRTTVKKRSDGSVQDLTSLTTRTIRYWQNNGVVTESTSGVSLVGAATAGTIKFQIGSPLDSGDLYWEWLLSDGTNPNMATRPDGKPFQIKVRKRQ